MTLYPLEDHTAEELAKLAEFEAAAVPSEVLREQVIAAIGRELGRRCSQCGRVQASPKDWETTGEGERVDLCWEEDYCSWSPFITTPEIAADAALAVVAAQPHPAVQRVEAVLSQIDSETEQVRRVGERNARHLLVVRLRDALAGDPQ